MSASCSFRRNTGCSCGSHGVAESCADRFNLSANRPDKTCAGSGSFRIQPGRTRGVRNLDGFIECSSLRVLRALRGSNLNPIEPRMDSASSRLGHVFPRLRHGLAQDFRNRLPVAHRDFREIGLRFRSIENREEPAQQPIAHHRNQLVSPSFDRAGLRSRFANAPTRNLQVRRSAVRKGKVGATATQARIRKIIPFCCCGDAPQFQMMRLPLKADDRSRAAKNAVFANNSLTACEIFHKVPCNRFTPPTFSASTLTSRSMPQADFPTFASSVS